MTYPDREPPDRMPPVSPSAARSAEEAKERRTEGVALASLTTWVRIILLVIEVYWSDEVWLRCSNNSSYEGTNDVGDRRASLRRTGHVI